MPNLYTIALVNEQSSETLTEGDKISIAYHNIFDYPLNFSDLMKWKANEDLTIGSNLTIVSKNGFYFISGKETSIYKRQLHNRISKRKMAIATKAANILSFLPTIKMIGITGSLAMENSNEESDIDLMIVTKGGSLWTTRAFAYLLISLFGIKKRSPLDKIQMDKLCLNIWLDENDLTWGKKDRNIYTAHEIAQVIPMINKNKTYEKFLSDNKWVLKFWPNAVKIRNSKFAVQKSKQNIFEKLAFKLQYQHMKSKISREVVTKTRALFHPQDWGKIVLSRLSP